MSLRACLVVAVAVAIAACKGPAGRDAADLSVASAPRGCPAFPSGSVLVVGQRYQANGAATSRTGMVAGFHRATDLPCTDSTMGTCVATVSGPRAADAGGGPASFGAGTISVAGGTMSIQQAPLPSASGTSYPMFQAMQAPWNGGETITVAAAGGEVPAFSTMLTAPAVLTVTAPAWPDGGPMTLSRADDLMVAWSGGGAGMVDVDLVGGSTATRAVEVHCRFPQAAGRGVVPAAMLASLPAASSGAVIVFTSTTQTLTAGEWGVDVALETAAVDERSVLFSYSVTFQ